MSEAAADSFPASSAKSSDADTLVVVSKIKRFIRDNSGLNSSQCCVDALTQRVAELCRKGIDNARNSGRKTVMGKDIV